MACSERVKKEEEGNNLMVWDGEGEKNQERGNVNSHHFKSSETCEKVI